MSSLRLIIFSDLHYTDEEQNFEIKRKLVEQAEPILEKLIEKINNTKELDAVINLGDFIQATKDKERDLRNIKKIWNKCKKIKYPFYTILGIFCGHQHWTKKINNNSINCYMVGSLVENINNDNIPDGVYFDVLVDKNNLEVEEKHIRI